MFRSSFVSSSDFGAYCSVCEVSIAVRSRVLLIFELKVEDFFLLLQLTTLAVQGSWDNFAIINHVTSHKKSQGLSNSILASERDKGRR